MPEVSFRQRYQRDGASAARIEEVAREVLAELTDPDSEASRAAGRAGLDPAVLADGRVKVTEGEQGAEPILTTIVVAIVISAGSKIAESLWTDVIWPRIRRRLGADALGPPTAPAEEG